MRFVLAAVFLLTASTAVLAQSIPTSEELARPVGADTSSLASPPKPSAAIALSSTQMPAEATEIGLHVLGYRIEGNTVLDEAVLDEILAANTGETSLATVYKVASALTAAYGKAGYVLSRVIVPPQNLDPNGSTVTLKAVEGYIDRVVWPESLSRYRDFFSDYAALMTAERPVRIATMERYLLLAGDLPGLTVSSRLEASETNTGASTLVIDVTEKPVEASIGINNWGSDGRGPLQFTTDLTVNNMLGQHEAVTLTWSGALELNELNAIGLGYAQTLTPEGTRLSMSGSWSAGAPGTASLTALGFKTDSKELKVELSHPLIRSREANLDLFGQFSYFAGSSTALGATLTEDRIASIRAGLRFDWFDPLGGWDKGAITVSQGIDGLYSTGNGNALASRSAGRVDYTKFNAELFHIQQISGSWSYLLGVSGQLALTPLLAPEECSFGGQSFGRAFDSGALAGDHCLSGIAEIRYDFDPGLDALTSAQLFASIDAGAVWRISPATGTPASDSAASVAFGLRTVWDTNTSFDVELDRRIAGTVGTSDWRIRAGLRQKF